MSDEPYFIFRRLGELLYLDPESVALSTELQARREDNITLLESGCKLARTSHNLVTNDSDFIKLRLLTYLR